jgi:hypothetical protein
MKRALSIAILGALGLAAQQATYPPLAPVSVLPPAASAVAGQPYFYTSAIAPGVCPYAGAGGTQGTALAVCVSDGTYWHAVALAPALTTPPLPAVKSALYPKCSTIRTTFCN